MIAMDEFKDTETVLNADERGRISLDSIANSRKYIVSQNVAEQLLPTPTAAMPDHEKWLWDNPEAIASVRQGLKEASAGPGQIVDFTRYADIEIED